MKNVVKVGKNGDVSLESFSSYIEIKKIAFVNIEKLPKKSLRITFFDKDKKKIKLKKLEE